MSSPVSNVARLVDFKTIPEIVEEVLQRHPARCKHLHPAEKGKIVRLPYELWAELCPVCCDELEARFPGLLSFPPEVWR